MRQFLKQVKVMHRLISREKGTQKHKFCNGKAIVSLEIAKTCAVSLGHSHFKFQNVVSRRQ